MSALLKVQGTLTEPNLRGMADDDCGGMCSTIPLVTLGSARPLTGSHQLKKLTIPFAFIFGFHEPVDPTLLVDCLPYNLEYLTLTDDLYEEKAGYVAWNECAYTGAVVSWLVNIKTYCPRLKRLCMSFMSNQYKQDKTRKDLPYRVLRKQLQALAREAGIEFGDVADCELKFPEPGWEPEGTNGGKE